jgi:ATP-dependent Lhr-like helicase
MQPENSKFEFPPVFHPAVSHWFEKTFDAPTAVQMAAWPEIVNEERVLIAAPTGSGKTLAAFLCAINELVLQSRQGALEDKVHVLYISPLKALSNDIEKNLQAPLQGIAGELLASGESPHNIRAAVRTGDTPPGERAKMSKRPPHILVTTPESLYLLLTSVSGRNMLAGVATLIVDEIHALAGNKRGSHLSLSLARLDALCGVPPERIGLSATQKPIRTIADYLCGGRECAIVDTGHKRHMDIQLELPDSPLAPVLANEVWEELYARLEAYILDHRTTRAAVPAPGRASWRKLRNRPPWQPVPQTPAGGRAGPESRPAESPGGDRFAGTRYRYWPRGPGLPDGYAGQYCFLAATHWPFRACCRRNP